jgi:hypothetical protein
MPDRGVGTRWGSALPGIPPHVHDSLRRRLRHLRRRLGHGLATLSRGTRDNAKELAGAGPRLPGSEEALPWGSPGRARAGASLLEPNGVAAPRSSSLGALSSPRLPEVRQPSPENRFHWVQNASKAAPNPACGEERGRLRPFVQVGTAKPPRARKNDVPARPSSPKGSSSPGKGALVLPETRGSFSRKRQRHPAGGRVFAPREFWAPALDRKAPPRTGKRDPNGPQTPPSTPPSRAGRPLRLSGRPKHPKNGSLSRKLLPP